MAQDDIITLPDYAVDGAAGTAGAVVVPNPASSPDSNDWLGQIFSKILVPVGSMYVASTVANDVAIAQAKAQAKINSYTARDPSVGSNNPKAALNAASRTLAQQWLPDYMLTPVVAGTATTPTTGGKVSLVGWGMLAILGLLIVWLVVRIFRKK